MAIEREGRDGGDGASACSARRLRAEPGARAAMGFAAGFLVAPSSNRRTPFGTAEIPRIVAAEDSCKASKVKIYALFSVAGTLSVGDVETGPQWPYGRPGALRILRHRTSPKKGFGSP